MHDLEINGESANGSSEVLREKNPEIPWRNIVGMRTDTAWKVVENDLSPLKKRKNDFKIEPVNLNEEGLDENQLDSVGAVFGHDYIDSSHHGSGGGGGNKRI